MARRKSGNPIDSPSRSRAAVLYGIAHAFDLGGTLARRRGRFGYGPAADAAALRGDWERAIVREKGPTWTVSDMQDGDE